MKELELKEILPGWQLEGLHIRPGSWQVIANGKVAIEPLHEGYQYAITGGDRSIKEGLIQVRMGQDWLYNKEWQITGISYHHRGHWQPSCTTDFLKVLPPNLLAESFKLLEELPEYLRPKRTL